MNDQARKKNCPTQGSGLIRKANSVSHEKVGSRRTPDEEMNQLRNQQEEWWFQQNQDDQWVDSQLGA